MDSSTIKSLVEDELARGDSFTSSHGITPANLRSLLVEPFAVRTDPDDLETQPRDMWVVLEERPTPTDGYVVVIPLPETGELQSTLVMATTLW